MKKIIFPIIILFFLLLTAYSVRADTINFGTSNEDTPFTVLYLNSLATSTPEFSWGVTNNQNFVSGNYQLQVWFNNYTSQICYLPIKSGYSLGSGFSTRTYIDITNVTSISEIDIAGSGTNTVDGDNCLNGVDTEYNTVLSSAGNPNNVAIQISSTTGATASIQIASSTPLTYGVNGFMGIILYALSAAGGIFTFRKFLS